MVKLLQSDRSYRPGDMVIQCTPDIVATFIVAIRI